MSFGVFERKQSGGTLSSGVFLAIASLFILVTNDDLSKFLTLFLFDGSLLLFDHLHFLVVFYHLREIIVRTQIGNSVFL